MESIHECRCQCCGKSAKKSNKDGSWTKEQGLLGKIKIALNLSTLSERRERGDAIQLFRIVNGQNKENWCKPI